MTGIARTTAVGGVVVALVAGAAVWAAVVDVAVKASWSPGRRATTLRSLRRVAG